MGYSDDKLKKVFKDLNWVAKTADIQRSGIKYREINGLLKEGTIIRLKRGIYQWVDSAEVDDLEILFTILPSAVLFLESALYYHGYTDRTPDSWSIAVNRDSNKSKSKFTYPLIKPYYLEPHLLGIGLMEGNINGIKLRVYDKERTICDVLKYYNKLDREIFNKAVQSYVKDSQKNISKLLDYGKLLHVSKKIETWIGVWL